jgi:hypothetical protein
MILRTAQLYALQSQSYQHILLVTTRTEKTKTIYKLLEHTELCEKTEQNSELKYSSYVKEKVSDNRNKENITIKEKCTTFFRTRKLSLAFTNGIIL